MTEKEIILIVLIRKLPYCNYDLNIVGISFDCLNNSIDYILICLETQTCLNSTLTFFNTIQSKTTEYSRSHLVPSPEGFNHLPYTCVNCFPLSNPAYFTWAIWRAIRPPQSIPTARGDPAGGWAGGSNYFTHMGSPSASVLKPQWPRGLFSSSGLR